MNNYRKHALNEFVICGWLSEDGVWKDDMQKLMCNQILELLDKFAEHGHSGSSAPYAINLFKTLAKFEPIKPITCDDSEWNEVSKNTFQNNRLSSVFKDGEFGYPYFLHAIVWCDENDSSFTGTVYTKDGKKIRSRQYIRIPFRPKTFFVDVINEDGESYIKDMNQLKQVKEYYKFSFSV